MGRRLQERRTDRASADEVAELEQQLWEFTKRPDPPAVPEASLRPGAFLYRVYRAWHSIGRGTGIASHSFRALRDELTKRDPPVRNFQPKMYFEVALTYADAKNLLDVMLETWRVERSSGGDWETLPLHNPQMPDLKEKLKIREILRVLRDNLIRTLFKGDDSLLLEEAVGVAPEVFMDERGRNSMALIMPTKGEVVANFSPANAYGGFSNLIERFFGSAIDSHSLDRATPLLIWVIRLPRIRDTFEFHQEFHALAIYSSALTNWFYRLCRQRKDTKRRAEKIWELVTRNSAFVVQGLPASEENSPKNPAMREPELIDDDLADIDPEAFLPRTMPGHFNQLPHVRRHQDNHYGLTVSIEGSAQNKEAEGDDIRYWLFPERPKIDISETAETTGLPILDAKESPGADFDSAYKAIFESARYRLGLSNSRQAKASYATLLTQNWKVLSIMDLQKLLMIDDELGHLK